MSDTTLAVEFDEKKIDAIFAQLNQCQDPGAAVGIAIGGKPIYRKGFGLASMELPVVLSPSIRMRIYSTTKHFTCLAYLLLCEEGKAGIDDPIGKYLPELHPVTHEVTMRQLMGHTGGLRDAHDINYQFSGVGRPVSSSELISYYRDIDDANFAPGTGWSYNNGGFLILSAVIERITGQSLEGVLRERIFEPVGLYDTLLCRFDTEFVPNSAIMHTTNSAGAFDRSYLGVAWGGEGGMVSTVDDMLRWLAHMDEPWVGSAASWALMKRPQRLANGTSTGYGLGLMSGSYRGVEKLWHAGGGMGANSQMLKVPAAGLNVAIMLNRHDVSGEELANQIVDACLPTLDPITAVLGRPFPTGIFRSSTTGCVIQFSISSVAIPPSIKAGQPMASINGWDVALEWHEDGLLWPAGTLGSVRLSLTPVGDPAMPSAVQFSDFGNLDDLLPVPPVDAPEIGAIEGRYRSEATAAEATICATDAGARLTMVGRYGSVAHSLECLARGIWRSRSKSATFIGGILSFGSAGGEFRFTNYRTRALIFRRRA